jgi:hypothetical protein
MEAIAVRRVSASDELVKPADYVFIGKRQPIVTVERLTLLPPSGFLKRIWWNAFGRKYELKRIVELLWPERDTVILNCPHCNQPIATTDRHRIVSLDPLTIETSLTCPYCRTFTFEVREGRIMTA